MSAEPSSITVAPLRFADSAAFHAWLAEHEDDSAGEWLIVAKQGAPAGTISYREAVAVALAHGWIDAVARRIDEHTFLQRFTPRRIGSNWSVRNRRAVEVMIAGGGMSPRGLAEVARARANGRWDQARPPAAG